MDSFAGDLQKGRFFTNQIIRAPSESGKYLIFETENGTVEALKKKERAAGISHKTIIASEAGAESFFLIDLRKETF